MHGKKKGSDLDARLAAWAGSYMGPDIIAPVSRGRQNEGVDGGSQHRRAAPKTRWAPTAVSQDHTGKVIDQYTAMNDFTLRGAAKKR